MKSTFLMDVSDARLARVGLFSYLYLFVSNGRSVAECNALNSEFFRCM